MTGLQATPDVGLPARQQRRERGERLRPAGRGHLRKLEDRVRALVESHDRQAVLVPERVYHLGLLLGPRDRLAPWMGEAVRILPLAPSEIKW